MNEHNIIHGNINLNNILLRFPGNKIDKLDVVLCDYGLTYTKEEEILITIYENPDYPPEFDNDKYTNKFDLWSLGIIIYKMYFEFGNGHLKRGKLKNFQKIKF